MDSSLPKVKPYRYGKVRAMKRTRKARTDRGVVFFHQPMPNDCMPTCVKMITDGILSGKKLSLSSLKDALGTTVFGTNGLTLRGNYTVADRLNSFFASKGFNLSARTVFQHKNKELFLKELIDRDTYPIVSLKANGSFGQVKVLCTKLSDEFEHTVIPIKVDTFGQKIYCIDPLCDNSDGVIQGQRYAKDRLCDHYINLVDFMSYWDATERHTTYIEPRLPYYREAPQKQMTLNETANNQKVVGRRA